MPISAKPFGAKKFATVNGRRMAYIDEGAGDAIVFQHGNPTSSYLWRNVMPHCAGLGRLIACDLIGMGDSDKLPDSGPAALHLRGAARLSVRAVGPARLGDRIIFVIHDWGSALGFEWANRNRDRVAGIAYMEAIVTPVTWADWPENARRAFQGFRSDGGEDMILHKNMFVERVLPGSVMRKLSRRGDGRIPPPVPQSGRGPPPDAHLAAPDPGRGRAGRCREGGRGLFGLARQVRCAEAVHQCRSRLDPHRPPARGLPRLAEPAGDHREGPAFHAGGFAGRDRAGGGGVRARVRTSARRSLKRVYARLRRGYGGIRGDFVRRDCPALRFAPCGLLTPA